MTAVLVATAATIGKSDSAASLNTVGDISNALTPFMGPAVGRLVFSFGIIGAAMVAAIVVSLASAWGFGEVAGYKRSLEHHPMEAPGSMPSTRRPLSGAPSSSPSYRTS